MDKIDGLQFVLMSVDSFLFFFFLVSLFSRISKRLPTTFQLHKNKILFFCVYHPHEWRNGYHHQIITIVWWLNCVHCFLKEEEEVFSFDAIQSNPNPPPMLTLEIGSSFLLALVRIFQSILVKKLILVTFSGQDTSSCIHIFAAFKSI